MTKVYDVFANKYIDKEDMSLYAPPERYIEIDDERWLNEDLNDGLNQQLMAGDQNDSGIHIG